ncbi:MAG TPA: 30S ribosomal protein S21 [bacterium]|nr:30S ribosomal protein S21 [bacterium]HDQ00752.1 30S ribosomal protein S21 [bacterium]
MITVLVEENESIDRAIFRFKKKVQQAGVIRDYRKNSYFLKPSQKKRIKHDKAVRRRNRVSEKYGSAG